MRGRFGWVLAAVVVLGGGAGWALLNRLAWDAVRPHARPTPPPPAGLSAIDADSCGVCHPDVLAEWREARMGQAMRNPAFLADWEVQGRLPICLACHAPFEAQQPVLVSGVRAAIPTLVLATSPNPAFDPAFQGEGVTCLACHLAPDGSIGTAREVTAPHATAVDPRLTSGEVCAGCHEMVTSPLFALDRPIIDTAGEHAAWRAQGNAQTCVDCHMSPGEGRRHHDFRGGWDAEVLKGAVSAQPIRMQDRVLVVLRNHTGHGLPTGETSGAFDVELSLLDPAGATLASGTTRLTRVVEGPRFHDVIDTTLGPGEVRQWIPELPVDAVRASVGVRVEVRIERLAHLPEARAAAVADGREVTRTIVAVERLW